ncbi:MAG: hypothetical protein R6W90_09000, partial [Ignavibacteriaceae bacterium]
LIFYWVEYSRRWIDRLEIYFLNYPFFIISSIMADTHFSKNTRYKMLFEHYFADKNKYRINLGIFIQMTNNLRRKVDVGIFI